VLQSFLPDRIRSQYNLRPSAHGKELINKSSQLNDRNVLVRMLYKTDIKLKLFWTNHKLPIVM